MKKGIRWLSLVLSTSLLVTGLTACGGGDTTEEPVSNNPDKPYEGVTLKYALSESASQGAETKEIVNMVKEKTGINIEFTIVPNTNAGEVDKTLVSLQAGDELDIMYAAMPKLKTYYRAGVLTPLDEISKKKNYDMAKVFGDNVAKYDDGQVYGLPAFNDIWLTFYNKKIFDDAGVEYPDPANWTWDKYIETAKKLNNPEQGIYGSFMLDYANYNYMHAIQSGAEAYKADGMSNFDDPKFKEGMKFFYDLGNVEKIQPDSKTYASGTYAWNSFVSTGKFGMFVCGGWAASMLSDLKKYPRDWECGFAPMPYPEGQQASSLAVAGCYAIPDTSKHKEAAFEAIKCIAENQYSLGYGRVPARIDLTDAEKEAYITEKLVPMFEFDKIPVEDIKNVWFNDQTKLYPEKIVGTADTSIEQIWIEEGQLYGQGGKDLDAAMKSIKERSDTAIKEEKAE